MTNEEAYLALQEACGFKPGDRVKILRRASYHENGWDNDWTDSMEMCIGGTFDVKEINGLYGIRLKDYNEAFPSSGHYYPFFVLELIEKKKEEKKLFDPDYRPEVFQKVLIRDNNAQEWQGDIFQQYVKDTTWPFVCLGSSYIQCIPFVGNENLLGRK